MNKLQIAKTAVTAVVGIGTAKIVGQIIAQNTSPEGVIDKVTVIAGSLALGSMVSDITRQYTDAKIDQIVNEVQKLFKK